MIELPNNINPLSKSPASDRATERHALRSALKSAAQVLLSEFGYELGATLPIKGAAAFSAVRAGASVRIAIRAGAERWVAISEKAMKDGDLGQVDEVFVITFKDPKDPVVAQLYRFPSSVIIAAGKKVFAAAEKAGIQWLPLDDTADTTAHSMAGGSLAKQGELLGEVPVKWVDGASDYDLAKPEVSSEPAPLKLTIAQAKAGLAASFGVSPEAIRIIIEG